MNIHNNTFLLILLFVLPAGLVQATEDSETWNYKNKNKMISGCFNLAKTKNDPIFKTIFYGKMADAEYEAFVSANGSQLLQSCQCVVNRIASEYPFELLSDNADQIKEYATQLSGDDGPCSTNIESLISDMRSRMSSRY